MKLRLLHSGIARIFFACAVFGVFFSMLAATTQAQSVTFAQFFERNGTNDFRFTNNGGTSGTFDTVAGGSAIFFLFQGINGLDMSLQGIQNARLTIVPSTTTTPATLNMNTLLQPLNQTVVIRITRDTPAPVGFGTRTNLLTATISTGTATPVINGTDTGNSAGFNVTTPDHTIVYTSDFLDFTATTQRNLGITLSSVTPLLTLGAGNFLQTFAGAGAGTFASNPVPVVTGPTASSATISGRVLSPSGRGLSNSFVSLAAVDGTTRTVPTNSFGYFSFSDVIVGQTAILSVNSKRFVYAPQIISVTEDLSGLTFTPQQ